MAAKDEASRGRPVGSRNTAIVYDEPMFEEPPTTARARSFVPTKWTEISEALKARPNTWARVSTHRTEESAKQAASGIRNGQRSGFEPKGSFEALFGSTTDGDFGVWARYAGAPSEETLAALDEAERAALEEEPVGV